MFVINEGNREASQDAKSIKIKTFNSNLILDQVEFNDDLRSR